MTTNLGSLLPLNEEKFLEEYDTLEEDSRKEKIQSLLKERNEVLDYNRKLYARSKESEGFKQDEDGNWIKTVVKSEEKPTKKDSATDEMLKRLDNLALKTAGISEANEVELFEKWKTETGRESDAIIDNSIFKKELEDLRIAKRNQDATSDVKGETGISGAKGTPEYWISKATKGADGNLLFPEEMPRELFTKVLDALESKEGTKSGEMKFYNSR